MDSQTQLNGLYLHTQELLKSKIKQLDYSFKDKKVVIVAGTNGKGSTSRFIGNLLTKAGCSVGVFTNPAMYVYNDQYSINGKHVELDECLKVKDELDKQFPDLDFHSRDLLVSLVLFEQLDYIVLEVGSGGRDDSVNVIDCDVAVITSISIDHPECLGYTVEEIGYHKAGIFRAGKPALIAGNAPESVVAYASKIGAELVQNVDHNISGTPFPSLNASLAVEAVIRLGIDIYDDMIASAINDFDALGYFDTYHYRGATVVVDHAHNIGGVEYFVDRIKQEIDLSGTVYVMCPFNRRKVTSHVPMIKKLDEIADAWVIPDMGLARLFTYKEMSILLEGNDKPLIAFDSVADAMGGLSISNGDVIIACGNLALPYEIKGIISNV